MVGLVAFEQLDLDVQHQVDRHLDEVVAVDFGEFDFVGLVVVEHSIIEVIHCKILKKSIKMDCNGFELRQNFMVPKHLEHRTLPLNEITTESVTYPMDYSAKVP